MEVTYMGASKVLAVFCVLSWVVVPNWPCYLHFVSVRIPEIHIHTHTHTTYIDNCIQCMQFKFMHIYGIYSTIFV